MCRFLFVCSPTPAAAAAATTTPASPSGKTPPAVPPYVLLLCCCFPATRADASDLTQYCRLFAFLGRRNRPQAINRHRIPLRVRDRRLNRRPPPLRHRPAKFLPLFRMFSLPRIRPSRASVVYCVLCTGAHVSCIVFTGAEHPTHRLLSLKRRSSHPAIQRVARVDRPLCPVVVVCSADRTRAKSESSQHVLDCSRDPPPGVH